MTTSCFIPLAWASRILLKCNRLPQTKSLKQHTYPTVSEGQLLKVVLPGKLTGVSAQGFSIFRGSGVWEDLLLKQCSFSWSCCFLSEALPSLLGLLWFFMKCVSPAGLFSSCLFASSILILQGKIRVNRAGSCISL